MSNSNLQKYIILNGQDSIAVFKDNGVVYRAADIESYTPIVLRNLTAGLPKRFDLQSVVSKDYQVRIINANHAFDNQVGEVAQQPDESGYYGSVRIRTIREGIRTSRSFLNIYESTAIASGWFLTPGDVLEVYASIDLTSLTLYCQPVYLENSIVVPEVILNAPVNSGNENPSPEPPAE